MFKSVIIFIVFGLVGFHASFAQSTGFNTLTDDALLEKVQKQTFAYFWDFAHPVSGLARERSNTSFGYGNEVVTTGGSGFGIMAIVVGTERKWITREEATGRLLKMVNFLLKAEH